MKKKMIAALLAACMAAPGFAAAEATNPNISPAMWVVKDADTTVYMFGTFHMLDGKSEWFNDEVKTAFDASSELVVEAIIPEDPAALQPLIMKYAVDPQGRKLSQKLTPEVKTKLDAQLTALGIPAPAVDPMEPWFVSMTLASVGALKLGMKPEHGADMVLKRAAKEKGKSIAELEGVEHQLKMLDAMPEPLQIAAMNRALDDMSSLGDTFKPMVAAWSSGDTEGLVRVMNKSMDGQPELYKVMLSDRNAVWADWIADRLEKPGVVFMAVGAGHLAGKDSVQALLAKKGIGAERVAN